MKYRHEWKHMISYEDMLTLRLRLPHIMKLDSHAGEAGGYKVRSLYFDTPSDKALRDKLNSVNHREKFRLRYYNDDTSRISLEKKSKNNGLCLKQTCLLSEAEVRSILKGELDWMLESGRPLCQELYCKMKTQGLKPKTIVDYWREPYVFGAGNARVTIDSQIRSGDFRTDFLNPDVVTLPVGDSPVVLEVKWDEFLPDIIKSAVSVPNRHVSAFSKYAQCRIYG